jgi:hypothetical protein
MGSIPKTSESGHGVKVLRKSSQGNLNGAVSLS